MKSEYNYRVSSSRSDSSLTPQTFTVTLGGALVATIHHSQELPGCTTKVENNVGGEWRECPTQETVRAGSTLIYDDGRKGHSGIRATVLVVDDKGMLVQFEDRAAPTRIAWGETAWFNHLRIA